MSWELLTGIIRIATVVFALCMLPFMIKWTWETRQISRETTAMARKTQEILKAALGDDRPPHDG